MLGIFKTWRRLVLNLTNFYDDVILRIVVHERFGDTATGGIVIDDAETKLGGDFEHRGNEEGQTRPYGR